MKNENSTFKKRINKPLPENEVKSRWVSTIGKNV